MNKDDERREQHLSDEGAEEFDGPPHLEGARLRDVLGTLREDIRAPATLRAEIMREVNEIPLPLWSRLTEWWLRPRTIRLSPAAATLALAAAVVAFVFWPGAPPTTDPLPVAGAGQVATRFVLVAPEASSVHLTGDFASWSSEGIVLEDLRGTGVWTADVLLPPGVYQYTFIVDGTEWRPDPTAFSQVDDGFGQVNSVVIVSPENAA